MLAVERPRRARAARSAAPTTAGRHTLLFFVSPTCPVCKTLLPVVRLARRAGEAADPARASRATGPAEHAPSSRAPGSSAYPYVLSSELGLAYQVGKLPYAVLIDARGVVRAKGLVNTREHVESLFEAARLGVASMQE